MKKIVAVAFIFTVITVAANAQSKSTIGFYIGPNFSNVDITSPNLSAANHSGYQFGGYWRKGGFLYGQTGLEFQHFQTELSTDTSSGVADLKRIQMPLYLGLNILDFSKKIVNIRAFGGPVIGYRYGYDNTDPEFSQSQFNRFGVNGTIGVGVDVLIFSLDGGYTFGLNDLFTGDFEGKGHYAFVNFGVRF